MLRDDPIVYMSKPRARKGSNLQPNSLFCVLAGLCFALYKFLHVPDCPQMHWCPTFGWLMASHMYNFVKTNMVQAAMFVALSADNTSFVDNQSVIVIHVYVMSHWAC
jgi:hypothetical protein